MSSNAAPAGTTGTTTSSGKSNDKGKLVANNLATEAEEHEDEEEDDEDEEDEEMDEDDEEDDDDEEGGEGKEIIDPSKILPRRTRGVKIDYSSAEALAKAGLKPEDLEDDADPDVSMDSTA